MMRPLVLLLLLASGCSDITSLPKFEGPTPTPLEASLTTEPPAEADGVPRDAVLRVTLDDYPDPDSVSFGPVLLRSGRGNFDADLRVDLVGRAIVITPRSPLEAMTTYEVVLDGTVRALSGRVLGRTVAFQISVGSARVPAPPPRSPITWDEVQLELAKWEPRDSDGTPECKTPDVAEAADPLRQVGGCAPCCHSTLGPSGDTRVPTRLLDLSSAGRRDDPVYGLVDTPSVGLAGSPYQLVRVAPHDSARSLFLRKLIGGNPHAASTDPPYPFMRVDGRRMPITLRDTAAPPLDEPALRLIQTWIDDGAVF
jgi:hypothetical protein